MIRTNGISKHIVMLLAVIAALIIVAAVTGTGMAYADVSVQYLDADGNRQTAENCISTSDWPKDENYPVLVGNSEEGKWYVLDSDVTYTSIEAVEEAISKLNSDKDPKGTKIAPLLVKSTKQTKNSIKITWKKAGSCKVYVYAQNGVSKTVSVK